MRIVAAPCGVGVGRRPEPPDLSQLLWWGCRVNNPTLGSWATTTPLIPAISKTNPKSLKGSRATECDPIQNKHGSQPRIGSLVIAN